MKKPIIFLLGMYCFAAGLAGVSFGSVWIFFRVIFGQVGDLGWRNLLDAAIMVCLLLTGWLTIRGRVK